jgi:hypothetical protein
MFSTTSDEPPFEKGMMWSKCKLSVKPQQHIYHHHVSILQLLLNLESFGCALNLV